MNETVTRALSGSVYIVLLVGCILHSELSFYILFGGFLGLTTFEFCKLVDLPKSIPAAFAVALFALFCDSTFYPFQDGIITGFTVLVSFKLLYSLFSTKEKTITNFEKWLYLIGYIIFPFVIITKIPFGQSGYNPKIIIGIFVLIWTNDTFAYLVGKSIGKHKLFERISPKKTIEGFIGGFVFTIIAGIIIAKYLLNTSNLTIWIGTAVLVSIFATLGDLIQSRFKRIAGVKDSGKIMPGHGGILDRLDSMIFVAPFIFLFYQILNYVS